MSTTFPLTIEKTTRTGSTYKVKVYRTTSAKGFTSYQVADLSGGVRKLLSYSDLPDAKAKAEAICDEMLARVKGEESIVLRGDEKLVYETSQKNLSESGITLDVATFTVAEAVAILGSNRIVEAARFFVKRNPTNLPRKTVREVADELIAFKRTNGLGERYRQDLSYRLGKLADSFSCDLIEVTGTQIQDWMTKLKLSARSQINFRRVIGTLFRFAIRRGYLPKDSDELSSLERVKAKGGDVEIFTPVEMSRLLTAAPKRFLPSLVIAAFCGLRSGEIERLNWDKVDLAKRVIEVSAGKSKTKTRRLAPIPDNAAQWLTPYAKTSGKVWRGNHDEFYDAQQEAAAATATKKNKAVEWKQNATRHSFISYRLADIGDENRVALESGNSPAMIHAHYKQLVRDGSEKAWFAIRPEAPANVAQMPQAAVV